MLSKTSNNNNNNKINKNLKIYHIEIGIKIRKGNNKLDEIRYFRKKTRIYLFCVQDIMFISFFLQSYRDIAVEA